MFTPTVDFSHEYVGENKGQWKMHLIESIKYTY